MPENHCSVMDFACAATFYAHRDT